jgi:hypothetical protein
VQYADNTLLILWAKARTLFNLKGILIPFSNSTSLHVNFRKSLLALINIEDTQAKHLAETFGCKVRTMSFTYLWITPRHTIPSLQGSIPLLSRIEGILGGIRKFQIAFTYLGLPWAPADLAYKKLTLFFQDRGQTWRNQQIHLLSWKVY